MKNTTIVFDKAAGRRKREPRFSLEFLRLHLHNLTLISWRDDTTPERWPLIEKVSSQSGSIKPNEGSAEVSGMSISILDDERFHQLAPLIYREDHVQLRGGYADVLESDWPVLFTGLVADLQLDASLGVWELSLNGLNFYKIASAFRAFGKTHLNGAINGAVTTIPVDSTNGTVAGDFIFKENPATSPCNGWIMIDDEVISFTGVNGLHTAFTGCARGQFQQCGASIGAAHSDNAEVKELFVLEGNPVDLILSLLTSTGGGFNGAYDLWDSDQGLGLPVANVNVAEFELQRNRFTLIPYRFIIKEGIKDVKQFIEEQICKTMNAYPLVTGAGQLSIHIYSVPFGQISTLEDDTINEIVNWKRGLGEIINYIIFKYDKSVTDDNFHTLEYHLEGPSVNAHGLAKSFTIEMDGVWTDLGGGDFCARRAVKIFNRYALGAISFGARVSFDKFKVDPSDIIAITHSRLPDVARGVRGVVHEWMEVLSVKPDMMRGEVEIEVQDTRMDEGKAGVITPNYFLDYMSESLEHRKWGFICDTSTHLMPNGDPPSLIIG